MNGAIITNVVEVDLGIRATGGAFEWADVETVDGVVVGIAAEPLLPLGFISTSHNSLAIDSILIVQTTNLLRILGQGGRILLSKVYVVKLRIVGI